MISTGQAEKYARSWEQGTYGAEDESPLQETTPLLESFITHLQRYRQSMSKVPLVLEGGAGSGDHAIRLVQNGFLVIANEYSEVATARILQRGNARLPKCTKTRLQVAQGDIVRYLREQESRSLMGFYANSVLHTFSQEERSALYTAVHRVQPQGGLVAVSFKAEGDSVQYKGEFREETEAGKIVEDLIGINRLFVRNPEPLIEELTKAGYKHLETFAWNVVKYIAVNTYDLGERKFIGFLAQKE
ncbi:class I SAM-dependent methyltransferase [Candidatus Woesearchaeota archaeon]|nr:class I SAM-dependent methyltransferase [Candidatus Woesearchaeota archaeon]